MKSFLKSLVALMLAFVARMVLAKYRPRIVMVTGSVGKTSTKDATAAALSVRFYLRASEKSYNSEFGVPLTIIGSKNPWTSLPQWLRVFGEGLALVLLPAHYPKVLVLEVGADRPGDLTQILKIATPDAVVVTRLPEVPVHVEAYASPQAVREEEFAPALALARGAPLIVCAEDDYASQMAEAVPASVTTFGFSGNADVRLGEPRVSPEGMETNVTLGKDKYPLHAKGALGRQQLYAPAAALAVARAFGLTAEEALQGLQSYVPPPGRARLLKGRAGAILVDDTYNASPAAVEEVLKSLPEVAGVKRRIAVLGDMLELGRYSKEEHARVGKLAATVADVVVAVGSRSLAIYEAAGKDALHFPDAREAAASLKELLREGDLVLIKGSQGMRMERITEALLADPADATELVRQDKEWLKKL